MFLPKRIYFHHHRPHYPSSSSYASCCPTWLPFNTITAPPLPTEPTWAPLPAVILLCWRPSRAQPLCSRSSCSPHQPLPAGVVPNILLYNTILISTVCSKKCSRQTWRQVCRHSTSSSSCVGVVPVKDWRVASRVRWNPWDNVAWGGAWRWHLLHARHGAWRGLPKCLRMCILELWKLIVFMEGAGCSTNTDTLTLIKALCDYARFNKVNQILEEIRTKSPKLQCPVRTKRGWRGCALLKISHSCSKLCWKFHRSGWQLVNISHSCSKSNTSKLGVCNAVAFC